jgi:hypothetical protein
MEGAKAGARRATEKTNKAEPNTIRQVLNSYDELKIGTPFKKKRFVKYCQIHIKWNGNNN